MLEVVYCNISSKREKLTKYHNLNLSTIQRNSTSKSFIILRCYTDTRINLVSTKVMFYRDQPYKADWVHFVQIATGKITLIWIFQTHITPGWNGWRSTRGHYYCSWQQLTGRCSLLLLVMLSVNKKKCSGVPTAYLPSLSIDKLTMVSSQCLSSSSILPFGNLNCFNLCQ